MPQPVEDLIRPEDLGDRHAGLAGNDEGLAGNVRPLQVVAGIWFGKALVLRLQHGGALARLL